jgi:hypothetical protein
VSAANQHWGWLNLRVIQPVHEEQLAEHGGPAGVRDEGMLASAMGSPQDRATYEPSDAATLAASHARGTSTKHPLRNGVAITSRRATSDIQNRKYRCAIGSSFAGSQVSRCPSARTA